MLQSLAAIGIVIGIFALVYRVINMFASRNDANRLGREKRKALLALGFTFLCLLAIAHLEQPKSIRGTTRGKAKTYRSTSVSTSEPAKAKLSTQSRKSALSSTSKNIGGRAPSVQAGQQKEGSFSGRSPTCGPIIGKSKADLQNVKRFCGEGIPEGVVVGAYAMKELLWIKVNYNMAQAMRIDPLSAEQLVKTWMKGWKKNCGSQVVTLYVEWKDTQLAKGETTVFSGDKVTLR